VRREDPALAVDGRTPAQVRRLIVAASIGNALEWFDLSVFGFFAAAIGEAMFPHADRRAAVLMAFGAFAVSYLVRPLGALVLGAAADRIGRKSVLLLSIVLMMAGTLLMAVMPPYALIGIWATVGVLLARFLQGFSAGGEFGSATALLVEQAPQRPAFMGSWQMASQAVSTGLASAFGVLLTRALTPDQLEAFGWRLPFFFGLLIGPVGLYVRRHIDEVPVVRAAGSASPILEILRRYKTQVLICVALIMVSTSATYLIVFAPTYAAENLGLKSADGFWAALVTSALIACLTPYAGALSDRVGQRRIMAVGAGLFLVALFPLFHWLALGPTQIRLMSVLLAIALIKTFYAAPLPALMSAQFPPEVRATGLNIAYNLGATIFGGFAPLLLAWSIAGTGDRAAPAFYLMGGALVAIAALAFLGGRRVSHLALA
jgi:MFS transporter, MHS family, proline/betaine transporter